MLSDDDLTQERNISHIPKVYSAPALDIGSATRGITVVTVSEVSVFVDVDTCFSQ
jgi:hypothetical protein